MQYKILFVDDEEYLLQSIQRQLRGKFDIDICTNALEALEKIKNQTYSVIVADYHMPEMNGVKFLAKAKEITPDTVRLLFTGKAELYVAISAVNEGQIFKFLSKPYSTEKLAHVLRLALGKYKTTYQRKIQAERNEFMALHDALTGLPNRIFTIQNLRDAMALARRNKTQVGILFLDLDGFKAVNDQFGHETGDKLLKYVARILVGSVREIDTVGRFGGDEFVIILQCLNDGTEASIAAKRIIDSFSNSIEIDSNLCKIGISIGITVFPSDSAEPEELIKKADFAMYSAKKQGGSKYSFCGNSENDHSKPKAK